jgi:hypothetical protein
MAKNRAKSTPSPVINEQALKIIEPTLMKIEAHLESLRGSISARVSRANTALADLQRRVSALEQRQDMATTKQVAKKGQAQGKRKGG